MEFHKTLGILYLSYEIKSKILLFDYIFVILSTKRLIMFVSVVRESSSCLARVFTHVTRVFAKIQMMRLNVTPYCLFMIGLFVTESTNKALSVLLSVFIQYSDSFFSA